MTDYDLDMFIAVAHREARVMGRQRFRYGLSEEDLAQEALFEMVSSVENSDSFRKADVKEKWAKKVARRAIHKQLATADDGVPLMRSEARVHQMYLGVLSAAETRGERLSAGEVHRRASAAVDAHARGRSRHDPDSVKTKDGTASALRKPDLLLFALSGAAARLDAPNPSGDGTVSDTLLGVHDTFDVSALAVMLSLVDPDDVEYLLDNSASRAPAKARNVRKTLGSPHLQWAMLHHGGTHG